MADITCLNLSLESVNKMLYNFIKMSFKKILGVVFLSQLIFFFLGPLVLAKADDLVIKDDGQVVLVITSEDAVLGVTTASPAPATPSKPAPASPPPGTTTTVAPKTVPIVAAHVESTVQVKPSTTNNKKLEVTVTKPTPTSTGTTSKV